MATDPLYAKYAVKYEICQTCRSISDDGVIVTRELMGLRFPHTLAMLILVTAVALVPLVD